GVRRVHPDLVRSAGGDRHLDERRRRAERVDPPETARRGLALLVDADDDLALLAPPCGQRCVDLDVAVLPNAANEREIALFHAALAEHRMQPAQHAAPLRDEEAARRPAVEPVDELERPEL